MPDKTMLKRKAAGLLHGQRFDEAKNLYLELCADDPGDAESWYMLGAINAQLGDFGEAIRCCHKTLELDARHVDALLILARIRIQQGQLEKAEKALQKLLHIAPRNEDARKCLEFIRQRTAAGKGGPKKAASSRRTSRNPKRLFKQGRQHQQRGEWEAAWEAYREALEAEPRSLALLTHIGLASHMLGRYEAAAAYHERALAIDPGLLEQRYNLGIAYKELTRLPEAATCYQEVLRVQPGNSEAAHGLGIVKIMLGQAREAEHILREALQKQPGNLALRSCLLLALNYHCEDPQILLHEHLEWDRLSHQAAAGPRPHRKERQGRRLRIGYLSPDFCIHPVAFFLEPLLSSHDKSRFEIYCYSNTPRADGITAHLQRHASGWRDIQRLTDEQAARLVERDRIDILVDLAGHTAHNRLGVFAHRPAPVQVSYLGYPNTTGLSAMDYRITDGWADPPGETDQWHSEKLLRLPDGFLCYRPPEGTVVTPPPSAETAAITFGSFNNLAKLAPATIALWSRLLHETPGTRLLLKTRPLADPAARDNVYRQFAAHGIDKDRLELIGWVEGMGGHLNLYGRIDIALDTFPYNGTTTTCEALWMGVPVVTLAGRLHAGRVGVSLLSRVGLGELVATSPEDYIAIASRLAGDRGRLQHLRGSLRQRMMKSTLCDSTGFTRGVEAVYEDLWDEFWHEG